MKNILNFFKEDGLTNYRLRSGFTLVEMLLYMGLLSIFLFVLTDLLVSTLDVRTESNSLSSVISDGEFVKNRMNYDIRRADTLATPVLAGDTGSVMSVVISGLTYTYASADGNITLTVGSDSQQLNSPATMATSFSVTRVGNGGSTDTVQVSYTLSSVATLRGQSAETRNYTFTIGGR